MPDITVHHLANSRSQRVLWCLEELGLDYQIVPYTRHPKTMRAPPSLLEVHPLGKSPVVSVDDRVLAESGHILQTLAEEHGSAPFWPEAGTEPARLARYWLHYAEGSLATPLLLRLILGRVRTAPLPIFVRPVARRIADSVDGSYTTPELDRHAAFLEDHLSTHAWFAGDAFSVADVQMSFALEAGRGRGLITDAHGAMQSWLERIHARPAYQCALERGGPYSLLDAT